MGRIVNKAELAEILGVSLNIVDSMLRHGMPCKSRGNIGKGTGYEIDVGEVMKWQVDQAVKEVAEHFDAVNLDEARRRKVAAEAALAELDLALKRGDAVSLQVVAKRWAGMVTAFKYRCLAIPAKLAPVLVAETDLVAVRGMLEREIHEALDELTEHEPETEVRDSAGGAPRSKGEAQGSGGLSEAATDVDGERVGRQVSKVKPRGIRRTRRLAH